VLSVLRYTDWLLPWYLQTLLINTLTGAQTSSIYQEIVCSFYFREMTAMTKFFNDQILLEAKCGHFITYFVYEELQWCRDFESRSERGVQHYVIYIMDITTATFCRRRSLGIRINRNTCFQHRRTFALPDLLRFFKKTNGGHYRFCRLNAITYFTSSLNIRIMFVISLYHDVVTSGAGTAYSSGTPRVLAGFVLLDL
jgi:hypothetical protein